jgi:hypothetical protein
MAFDYTQLITSEHNQKPKYTAMVKAVTDAWGSVQDFDKTLPLAFDLDTAAGVQLDAIGLWVGQTRLIPGVLLVEFFGFSDNPAALTYGEEGFPSIGGRFYEEGEPIDATSLLADPEYRLLIRGRIVRNHAKGLTADFVRAISFMFQTTCVIDDTAGNMTIGVYIGRPITLVERAIILNLDILPRPAGVRIATFAYYDYEGGYFGFDGQDNAKTFGEESLLAYGIYPQYIEDDFATVRRELAAFGKNESGNLYQVSANEIRKAATKIDENLILYSEDFDRQTYANTTVLVWGRFNLLAVTPGAAPAPDGLTACAVIPSTTGAVDHGLDMQAPNQAPDNAEMCGYVDAAPFGYSFIRVRLYYKNGSGADVDFDLANGLVTRVSQGTGGSGVTGEIIPLTNGFFRCIVRGAKIQTGGSVAKLRIWVMPATNTTVYAGDGVSGVLLARAKHKYGSDIGQYIKTTGFPKFLFADAGYVVENAATNLWTNSLNASMYNIQSGFTLVSNNTVAPDGTLTADEFSETAVSTGHYIERQFTDMDSTIARCYAVYIKPKGGRHAFSVTYYGNGYTDGINTTFSLQSNYCYSQSAGATPTIEPLADGWYRLAIGGAPSVTPNTLSRFRIAIINGSTTYTGDTDCGFYLWHSQVENGLVPSSPILTAGSSLQRPADTVSILQDSDYDGILAEEFS